MEIKDTPFPQEKLAEQITELFQHGGTLGDVYNYDDHDYEVLYSFGHGLYTQGRYMDAVKVFGYLTMHNHLERKFLNAYAASLQMIKSYEEAIQFYSMASVMDMSDPVPTFHTCECMIAMGNVDDAKQGLMMVLKQCKGEKYLPLKERTLALLDLLNKTLGKSNRTAEENING